MKRALVFALFALGLMGHARADCTAPTFSNYPRAWQTAGVSYPSAASVEQKLALLAQAITAAATAAELKPDQREALQRVAEFVSDTQKDLRTKDVDEATLGNLQPRSCPGLMDPASGTIKPACDWEILGEPAVQVPLPDPQSGWTCEFQSQFAGYVRTGHELLAALAKQVIDKIAHALVKYDKAWTNLISEGYSQFPWEVALNGLWINHKSWGPNPNFAILLHPAVGAGVANLNHKHGNEPVAAAILSVEGLGYLRYFANHKHYAGAGLTGTISNLQGQQIGLGVVAHASGFTLGVSRNFWGANKEEIAVFWLFDVGRSMDDNFLAKKIPDLIQKHTHTTALLSPPP